MDKTTNTIESIVRQIERLKWRGILEQTFAEPRKPNRKQPWLITTFGSTSQVQKADHRDTIAIQKYNKHVTH
jgi:hypothetical protein